MSNYKAMEDLIDIQLKIQELKGKLADPEIRNCPEQVGEIIPKLQKCLDDYKRIEEECNK